MQRLRAGTLLVLFLYFVPSAFAETQLQPTEKNAEYWEAKAKKLHLIFDESYRRTPLNDMALQVTAAEKECSKIPAWIRDIVLTGYDHFSWLVKDNLLNLKLLNIPKSAQARGHPLGTTYGQIQGINLSYLTATVGTLNNLGLSSGMGTSVLMHEIAHAFDRSVGKIYRTADPFYLSHNREFKTIHESCRWPGSYEKNYPEEAFAYLFSHYMSTPKNHGRMKRLCATAFSYIDKIVKVPDDIIRLVQLEIPKPVAFPVVLSLPAVVDIDAIYEEMDRHLVRDSRMLAHNSRTSGQIRADIMKLATAQGFSDDVRMTLANMMKIGLGENGKILALLKYERSFTDIKFAPGKSPQLKSTKTEKQLVLELETAYAKITGAAQAKVVVANMIEGMQHLDPEQRRITIHGIISELKDKAD